VLQLLRDRFVSKAASVSEDVRLQVATLIVERKTRKLAALASQVLANDLSQEQLQNLVSEVDAFQMRTAAHFNVSANALAVRCESLNLLRSLGAAKHAARTIVVPVAVVPAMQGRG
jgi:hypothetical protein